MEKNIITIDWNMLSNLSYRTKLGKSLENTLRKFKKEDLLQEINDIISFFTENESKISYSHRIKSIQSCFMKYEKYYPSIEVDKVFNDILGIRIIIDEYSIIDSVNFPDINIGKIKVADMRNGKANDDGYRGIHLYFQKDNHHYPIEIQFMTSRDRLFNEWLHTYIYKYVSDNNIGKQLRCLYDKDIIVSEDDFRKEMQKLCAI